MQWLLVRYQKPSCPPSLRFESRHVQPVVKMGIQMPFIDSLRLELWAHQTGQSAADIHK
jgi:hypothetical protein